MKFYLASSCQRINRRYVEAVAEALERRGWECTFAWWENFEADALRPTEKQELELMGIREAQILVGMVDDNALGTWWELGAGWGLGKRVLVIDRCSRQIPLPWVVTGPRVRMSPALPSIDPDTMAEFIAAESSMCPVPCPSCGDPDPLCKRCETNGR